MVATNACKNKKQRLYNPEYIKFGFRKANDSMKPQCIFCHVILGIDSNRPSKLKLHLTTKHPNYKEKPLEFFVNHNKSIEDSSIVKSCQNLIKKMDM